jgi:transcriptional regulator with PAS, ATPase and Fis domain
MQAKLLRLLEKISNVGGVKTSKSTLVISATNRNSKGSE